jgi:hypothetical protein
MNDPNSIFLRFAILSAAAARWVPETLGRRYADAALRASDTDLITFLDERQAACRNRHASRRRYIEYLDCNDPACGRIIRKPIGDSSPSQENAVRALEDS